jgi:hypothetical protein
MKKGIILMLLANYLLCATQLYELLKIPMLLHHYAEHKHQNNTLTFADFLHNHYNHPPKDSEKHQHSKLPFKSLSNATAAAAFIAEPTLYVFVANGLRPKTSQQKQSFGYYFAHSSSFFANIWQPPQA